MAFCRMLPSMLWRSMATVDELLDVAETWKLTLEKHGCMHLVRAGTFFICSLLKFLSFFIRHSARSCLAPITT